MSGSVVHTGQLVPWLSLQKRYWWPWVSLAVDSLSSHSDTIVCKIPDDLFSPVFSSLCTITRLSASDFLHRTKHRDVSVALLFLQFQPGHPSPTGESSNLKVLCSKFPVSLSLLNFSYYNWWLKLLILYVFLFHIPPRRRGSWLSQLVPTVVHPTPISTRIQKTMEEWMKDFLLVCTRERENTEHCLGGFEVPVKTSSMAAVSLEHPKSWRQSPPIFTWFLGTEQICVKRWGVRELAYVPTPLSWLHARPPFSSFWSYEMAIVQCTVKPVVSPLSVFAWTKLCE